MTDRRKVTKIVRTWIAVIAVAIIIGYGAFRAKDLAEGPKLDITSPENGMTLYDSLLEIRGTAENISFLTLNGNKIFTDESGIYDEQILLAPGYNVITLTARDRFGRIATKTLQLTYKKI